MRVAGADHPFLMTKKETEVVYQASRARHTVQDPPSICALVLVPPMTALPGPINLNPIVMEVGDLGLVLESVGGHPPLPLMTANLTRP